jgi:phage/plasmid-like protein (TIGR03299 family)
MPADLDYSRGRAAVMVVGETAWHREGHVFVRPPETIEEAMAASLTDFPVGPRSIYWRDVGGSYVHAASHQAIVRTDTEALLGVVGRGYRPIQNLDAFRVLQPLLDDGLATIETCGALRDGRDVWMLVRFRLDDPVVLDTFEALAGKDGIATFGLMFNNHTGERQGNCRVTPTRVVCRNTLEMAIGSEDGFYVRHTGDVAAKLRDAATEMWSSLVRGYREAAGRCLLLSQYKPMTQEQFREAVLDAVVSVPARPDYQNEKRFETAMAKSNDRRGRIEWLWENGAGHVGDRSAWEAYNGLVEALDHDDRYMGRTGRVESLHRGALGQAKRRVLGNLLRLAGVDA